MKDPATVTRVIVGTVVLAVTLTACTPNTPADTSATTSDRGPSLSGSPSTTPAPDVLSRPDATEAQAVIDRAMAQFVSHKGSATQWWSAFSPYLGDEATVAFEYTNPANIPAHRVTSRAILAAAPSATEASFLVPTDVGQYRATMNRQAAGGQWTITKLTPPDGLK